MTISYIDSLLFGAIDLSAGLRVEPTWDALLYARSRGVHAAATASLDPIDVPYLDLDDTVAFETADSGLVVVEGKLIEKPVLRAMYRIVAIAERLESRPTAKGRDIKRLRR